MLNNIELSEYILYVCLRQFTPVCCTIACIVYMYFDIIVDVVRCIISFQANEKRQTKRKPPSDNKIKQFHPALKIIKREKKNLN